MDFKSSLSRDEINKSLNRGINCPICGMSLIDLAHDGYECGEPDYHDFHCTCCGIDITIEINKEE